MFSQFGEHLCALFQYSSRSLLPPLKPTDGWFARLLRNARKLILVSEYNPQTYQKFVSNVEIEAERRRQVESGSWIIHPCSIFRLFYEMWMAVIILLCLNYMPVSAAFPWAGMPYIEPIENFVFPACWIDIIINFRTGYIRKNKQVEMGQKKIALHYILSLYLISDIISTIPVHYFMIAHSYHRIFHYLIMAKIVRIYTYFQYLDRTLNFFKINGFYLKLLNVLILIIHYVCCFRAYIPCVLKDIEGKFEEYEAAMERIHPGGLTQAYCYYLFHSVAALFNIEKVVNFKHKPWFVIAYTMLCFIIGKIITSFVAVIVSQHMSKSRVLETKYQAMISQVNAFMKAHHFPEALQKRLRQYYWYKYRGKYLNESRIDRNISDKLRKEIKYNTCRQIMESHSFFTKVPQDILEKIVTHLKEEIYLPTDIIIRAGTPGDCMYFLASGTVSVTTPSGKEVCHLQDGDYFGEISLINPDHRTVANITALETCEVFRLERKGFRKYFETNPLILKPMKIEAKRRYLNTKQIEDRFVKIFNS